jgi:two-component sensor histidine kinase
MEETECELARELAELRERLAFREREFRELNHRVANSLQMASAFLGLQLRQIRDPIARELLTATSARLSAVGKLHRYLYAHDLQGLVDLSGFLHELCPTIADSTGLGCDIDADPLMIRGETAQQIGIIINELALNAAKHGYQEGRTGTLKIHSGCDGERLCLEIADDGLGLGDDFDVHAQKGLGMSIVLAIARQLGGTLKADSPSGARFTLTVPLKVA